MRKVRAVVGFSRLSNYGEFFHFFKNCIALCLNDLVVIGGRVILVDRFCLLQNPRWNGPLSTSRSWFLTSPRVGWSRLGGPRVTDCMMFWFHGILLCCLFVRKLLNSLFTFSVDHCIPSYTLSIRADVLRGRTTTLKLRSPVADTLSPGKAQALPSVRLRPVLISPFLKNAVCCPSR